MIVTDGSWVECRGHMHTKDIVRNASNKTFWTWGEIQYVAWHLANNCGVGVCTPHINVKQYSLHDLKEEGLVQIEHVLGAENDFHKEFSGAYIWETCICTVEMSTVNKKKHGRKHGTYLFMCREKS